MKIYVDMDGVLCNFDEQYKLMFGERPAEVKRQEQEFWQNWDRFVLEESFIKLKPMPDAHELIGYLKLLRDSGIPVEILSSSGGKKHHENVRAQKEVWLAANEIDFKPNIVPGGHLKAKYAKGPWYILIDDMDRNIESFEKAGGTGILHTSAHATIRVLEALHYEWRHPSDSII